MQALESRAVLTGALLLCAALTGVATTAMGRPLNLVVSTAHKLLALAAVVFAVLIVLDILKATSIETSLILLVVATGLFVLAIFATGALLTSDKLVGVPLKAAHASLSFLVIAGMVLLAYMRLR